jgi:hypothetical protein
MRSTDTLNQVPQVSPDQSKVDQTLKHVRKLRWIGKEREAQKIFRSLGDINVCVEAPEIGIWSRANSLLADDRDYCKVEK